MPCIVNELRDLKRGAAAVFPADHAAGRHQALSCNDQ
jgi:hypothetical protein